MRKSIYLPKSLAFISEHAHAFFSAINQIGLSPLAGVMTFTVIGIVLAMPMGLFVLLQNVQTVTSNLHNSTKISLYLQNNISQNQINDLERILSNDNSIAVTHYISPDEGLNDFQKQSGFGNVLSELQANPLPGVMIVTPAQNITSAIAIQDLYNRLAKLPMVNHVVLDMVWLNRLIAIVAIGDRIIYALLGLFALAVLLIIGNTIRLTIQNHRQEITVTKLLGAKNSFIRRPFLYSGVIYGLMGGIIAWLLVDSSMLFISPTVSHLAKLYNTKFFVNGMDLKSTLVLLLGGSLLGYVGSWLTVGKHIRQIEPKDE